MALAEFKTLYESNYRQIAETLRNNADAIEAGKFGKVSVAVYVLLTVKDGREEIEVFGLGDTDYWKSVGILQGGLQKLLRMIP